MAENVESIRCGSWDGGFKLRDQANPNQDSRGLTIPVLASISSRSKIAILSITGGAESCRTGDMRFKGPGTGLAFPTGALT